MLIKTIKGPNNSEVSYCTERGGIISSIKLRGREILYFDEETFLDTDKNVRGGIPFLFPNAGLLAENLQFPKLEQHGFARKLIWQTEKSENGFRETLLADEATKEIFPYIFSLSVSGKFEVDESLTIVCEVENREDIKEMPLAMGLHPYFKVPDNEKKNIKFDFEGGKIIEEQFPVWANGGTLSIDNPKIKNQDAVLKIVFPSLGTLLIDASAEYKKIWIWSLPGKDFICVEPVMRDINGLINEPEIIKARGKFSMKLNLKIEN